MWYFTMTSRIDLPRSRWSRTASSFVSVSYEARAEPALSTPSSPPTAKACAHCRAVASGIPNSRATVRRPAPPANSPAARRRMSSLYRVRCATPSPPLPRANAPGEITLSVFAYYYAEKPLSECFSASVKSTFEFHNSLWPTSRVDLGTATHLPALMLTKNALLLGTSFRSRCETRFLAWRGDGRRLRGTAYSQKRQLPCGRRLSGGFLRASTSSQEGFKPSLVTSIPHRQPCMPSGYARIRAPE